MFDWRRAVPFAACLLLAALWFGDGLLPGRTVIPAGHLDRIEPWKSEGPGSQDPVQQHDMVFQFLPWADFFRDSVLEGRFPLWNPYNYLGTPFFANPQAALLFPLTWLHVALPSSQSFALVLLLKLFLAAAGTWCWLRGGGLRPEAAAFGAVAFACSMHTVVSLPFPYASVSVLFPWLLVALRRAAVRAAAGPAVGLTAATALVVVAGQPQSALVALTAAAAYALFLVPTASGWRSLPRVLVPVLAGGLLAAVQWVPSLAYTAESMVPEGPRLIHSGYPYAPASFLTLLIPDFFGSHLEGVYWGFPGYHDLAMYSSVLVVLLAVSVLFRMRGGSPMLAPALVAAGGVVILAGLPPFEWLLDLPGFELIRRNKLVPVILFALAELAARGLQDSLERSDRGLRRLLAVGAGLIVAGAWGLIWFRDFFAVLDPDGRTFQLALRTLLVLAGGIILLRLGQATRAGWALCGLLLLDLAPLGWPLNPRGTGSLFEEPPRLVRELEGSPPRIYGMDNVLFPNSAAPFQLQDLRGYDVMTPRRLFRLMQHVDPSLGDAWSWLVRFDPDEISPETRMRRIIGRHAEADEGVKAYLQSESYWSVGVGRIVRPELFERLRIEYLLTAGSTAPPGYLHWGEVEGVRISRRPDTQPFRLYSRWIEADEATAVNRLMSADPDVAVVEARLPEPPVSAGPPGEVRLSKWGPERQVYSVALAAPAVLAVYERWSEGWRAELADGSSLEVVPCGGIFRCVYLEPGEHRVEFSYRPAALTAGLGLSGLGVVLMVAWAFGLSRKGLRGGRGLRRAAAGRTSGGVGE